MSKILLFPSRIEKSFETTVPINPNFLPPNSISLAEEKEWREISRKMIENEKHGIAKIVVRALEKRKNTQTAQIIPFPRKKRA